MLGGALSLGTASQGGRVAWIVPIYRNGRTLWRWADNTVSPLKASKKVNVNKSEREIEFDNGGFFGIYSADNEDSIRGEHFHLVIMDEAARISETAWTDAIQPTLADENGDAFLISTPRGRNWFWNEFQRGVGDNQLQKSWTAPSSDNPNPNIQQAFRLVRDRVPDLTYRQEWLGEFVDAEGSVFRRITEAAILEPLAAPLPDHIYQAGVDVAASIDYTVVSIMDVALKQLVAMDRFTRVDYNVLEDRLDAIYKRFHLQAMTIEVNSIGLPVIDHMRGRDMNIIPFLTTGPTKQSIIMALQSAFEHGEIKVLKDPVLIGELLSFESKRNPSGSFSYAAPEGSHDDTVMALAIAWHSIVGTTRADAWIAAMEADMEASTIPALQMPKGGQWDTQRRMG